MGIEVLVPDVNRSVSDFTPVVELDADAGTEKRSIVFGLSAVRNVGSGLVDLLIAEREANGPFVDFYDFVERVDFQVLNKKTIESLIKAGGFDSLGHPRQGLLRSFEHIIDTTVSRRRERDMGVMSLFGEIEDAGTMFDERPPIPEVEFAKRERLSFEKEMLGLYVSDHPLMGAEASLRRRCDGRLTDLRRDGRRHDPHLRWRGHGPPAEVDQEGRPHGRLRAGRPPDLGRGDGVPQVDDRPRPQAQRRRASSPSARGSTHERTSRSSSPWRSSRSSRCPARRSRCG